MAPSLYRDGRYRTDVAAAGKVYRQYRGRGRPRYKVQKKQNRPKDRFRSRGVVMRSQGSPRTTRPFRTGAVTKLDPLALFHLPRHPLNPQPCSHDYCTFMEWETGQGRQCLLRAIRARPE